jgi:hypothetical protein
MIKYNITTANLNPINKVMETIFVRNPTTGNSYTGNGTETILDYVLIPANTFQANDIMKLVTLQTKVGTAGNATNFLRFQTVDPVTTGASGIISGGAIVGRSSGTVWNKLQRDIVFMNSLTSQIVHNTASSAIPSDILSSSALFTALSIDFSIDQYILCTTSLAGSADTVTLRSWSCEILRA